MFWFLLTAIIGLYLVYRFGVSYTPYWEKHGVPYMKGWPIIGSSPKLLFGMQSFFDFTKEMYMEHLNYRYFGLHFYGQPFFVIGDLELIKQVTVKDFDHFVDHSEVYPAELDVLWDKNLFTMKGQRWREMRATLSPAFTGSKMRSMFILMSDCAKDVVEYLVKHSKGQMLEIDVKDLFTRYANDVIATSSFGIKCDTLNEPNNEFLSMGKKLTNLTGWRSNVKFTLATLAPKILKIFDIPLLPKDASKYFKQIVVETIVTREKANIVRPDMINLLIEAKKGQLKHERQSDEDAGFATVQESDVGTSEKRKMELSEDDLAAQAMIFFFAGFETTSTFMTFMAMEMSINIDVQRKLQEEIDGVLKGYNGDISYETIMNMKYLDQVVSESLRKWTPVVQLDRVCVKDYVIHPKNDGEKPVTIKKGIQVTIPTIGIHYDPNYFPNPEKFDPERFSEDEKSSIVPGSYMPFGVGPRNCIGSRFALLEVKILFFRMLSKFEIKLVKRSTVPVKITRGFVHSVDGACWVGLKPRNTSVHY